jgi:hypothetical protein
MVFQETLELLGQEVCLVNRARRVCGVNVVKRVLLEHTDLKE